jgi:hypothetical protein
MHNKRRQEQHQENEEQDLCNACRRDRQTAESEDSGNDRDQKKTQCPIQHYDILVSE